MKSTGALRKQGARIRKVEQRERNARYHKLHEYGAKPRFDVPHFIDEDHNYYVISPAVLEKRGPLGSSSALTALHIKRHRSVTWASYNRENGRRRLSLRLNPRIREALVQDARGTHSGSPAQQALDALPEEIVVYVERVFQENEKRRIGLVKVKQPRPQTFRSYLRAIHTVVPPASLEEQKSLRVLPRASPLSAPHSRPYL